MSHAQKHFTLPRSRGHFFIYLWIVRGLSLYYAIKLTRALSWNPRTYNARTARNYFRSYQLHHWEFAEDEPNFNLWAAPEVVA